MSEQSVAEFLQGVEMLSALDAADLERLSQGAERLEFGFGDTILNAGDELAGVYVVVAGGARLLAESGGKETSLGIRKTGDG